MILGVTAITCFAFIAPHVGLATDVNSPLANGSASSFVEEDVMDFCKDEPKVPVQRGIFASFLLYAQDLFSSVYASISNFFRSLFFCSRADEGEKLSGIAFHAYWQKAVEAGKSENFECPLSHSSKETIPLRLYPLPNEKNRKYAVPPENMGILIRLEDAEKSQTLALNDFVENALIRVTYSIIKSYLAQPREEEFTDLLVALPKRVVISGTDHHTIISDSVAHDQGDAHRKASNILSPRMSERKALSHKSVNVQLRVQDIAVHAFRELEKTLPYSKLETLNKLRDRIYFHEIVSDGLRTVAQLDSRCGLLYDAFEEVSSRYSRFVADETTKNTFLAFFSDEQPPLELQKVLPVNMWKIFRKDAVSELKKTFGKFVPCRAHSAFSSAESSFRGLCTSARSMTGYNVTHSPLERRGYHHNPVPEHMRSIWPSAAQNAGVGLEGICFVATDRLVLEGLYDTNRELALHKVWENAGLKHTGGKLTHSGRDLIRRLAQAKLFCPCQSSVLSNRIVFHGLDYKTEVLVQMHEGAV